MLIAGFLDGLSRSACLVSRRYSRRLIQPLPTLITRVDIHCVSLPGTNRRVFVGAYLGRVHCSIYNMALDLLHPHNLSRCYILMILLFSETYHPVLLRSKARKFCKETGDEMLRAPTEKTSKVDTEDYCVFAAAAKPVAAIRTYAFEPLVKG
jgi:hypothetical protein